MTMSTQPEWDGRAVKFVDFDIATGEALLAAATSGDTMRAMYLALIASARYADDDKPVFASVDEVRALPFRLLNRIRRLASLATEQNQLGKTDEDDGPLPEAGASVPAPARSGAWENGR
jgi:hypothetical protein